MPENHEFTVAFDVDGTLMGYNEELREEVCQLLIAFLSSGFQVVVWSGGGRDRALSVWHKIVRKYELMDGMSDRVAMVVCKFKDDSKPDLTIDDQQVDLGKFNVCWRPKC